MERITGRSKGCPTWAALLLVALVVLVSCQTGETDLPFESIAQAEDTWPGPDHADTDPDLIVITSAEEVETSGADVRFGSDVANQLRAINYRSRFVVIVVRGALGGTSSSYAVDIPEVTRHDDRVIVQTHFGELGPEQGALMAFSSPYHAISIAKEGRWAREIQFVLKEDGKTVKKRTHFVP